MKQLYSIEHIGNSREYHIFKTANGIINASSVCGLIKHKAENIRISSAKTEIITRIKCAELGRTVWATCIKELYTTYK